HGLCRGETDLHRLVPVEFSHMCYYCWRDNYSQPIVGYSANPITLLNFPAEKLDPKVIYQGVELEVECRHGSNQDIARAIKSDLGRNAITKQDGSLYDGFEICTVPMTLDEHRKYWQGVFKNPQWMHIQADETPRAGLHIHASRAPLSKLQIARFIHFITQPHNREFVQGMAGRRENSYCVYGSSGQTLPISARKL